MAKRRTRKQKQEAKHDFTIRWEPGSSTLKSEASVKRQFPNNLKSGSAEAVTFKKANNSVQELDLPGIKKNIRMSLIYTGLILTAEIVLYFIWNVK